MRPIPGTTGPHAVGVFNVLLAMLAGLLLSPSLAASHDARPDSFADLIQREKPAVVNIATTQVVQENYRHDPDSHYWDRWRESHPPEKGLKIQSLGSGFFISKEGLILTNEHVVARAERVTVRLSDEREFTAEVIGQDAKTDIALLRIQGDGDFPVVDLGNSDDMRVGDWVVAIGNPFGLEQSVTAGIVSAKGRVIGSGPYDDFIQTDASINPGNSGGPLFNLKGEVVGINTAISSSGQGIGFAIPINMAKKLIPQLRETGKVTRGWLGVSIQDVTEELARSFDRSDRAGALVADITDGGPAEDGGVKRGDIIVEFDGKKILKMKELPIAVAGTEVGKKVNITVIRSGHPKALTVQVGELAEKATASATGSVSEGVRDLGMSLEEFPDESMDDADVQGLYVLRVDPQGPASEAGIRMGDTLLEIDRKAIRDLKGYRRILQDKKGGDTLLILVKREAGSLYLTLKVR